MLYRSALVGIFLTGQVLAVNPPIIHDAEDFERPGVLQFHGLTEEDEVRIDGELVPAKGLARANYSLLIAPGEYVVSVKFAGSPRECVSRVNVEAGRAVRPKCVHQPTSRMTD